MFLLSYSSLRCSSAKRSSQTLPMDASLLLLYLHDTNAWISNRQLKCLFKMKFLILPLLYPDTKHGSQGIFSNSTNGYRGSPGHTFESFLILHFDTTHLMPGHSYWLCLRRTATTSSELPPCLICLKQHCFSTQILQQTLTTLQDPQ